jgi:hypothetical protein
MEMANTISKVDTLRAQQYKFAAHLRDPENVPPPSDIEDRRMAIYRNLFINNVTNFLCQSFPVLSDLMEDERWKMLIRDFYRDHKSHSPLFPDMPKEFLDYLANERTSGQHSDNQDDPPFIYELAHYEWIETGLALAEEPPANPEIDPAGDLLAHKPVTSTLAWLFSYQYPVNEIGKDNQPDLPAAEPLHYLLFRDQSDKVNFLKLNIVSARLFEILNTNTSFSGHDALGKIAAEMSHPEPDRVITSGSSILKQWHDKGIVLGTLPVKL